MKPRFKQNESTKLNNDTKMLSLMLMVDITIIILNDKKTLYNVDNMGEKPTIH